MIQKFAVMGRDPEEGFFLKPFDNLREAENYRIDLECGFGIYTQMMIWDEETKIYEEFYS